MPRFRCLILGLLILCGLAAGSEYVLRYHLDLAAPKIGLNSQYFGWTTCDHSFLAAPVNQTITYTIKPGVSNELHFGSSGFRQSATKGNSTAPETICLGDERVLAPEIKHQQTFVALWSQMSGSSSGGVADETVHNGGMPLGCPLLWQIQLDERIIPHHPRRVVCFIGRQSLQNDFNIRRSVVFDEDGQIVACKHPGIKAENRKSTQAGQKNPLEEYALLRLGFPFICKLFLNDTPQSDPLRTAGPLVTKIEGSREFLQLSLHPLLNIAERCRAVNIEFVVVYLPDQSEVMDREGNQIHGNISADHREVVSEYLMAAGVPFIDLTSLLQSDPQVSNAFLNQSDHFSVVGHQMIADLLIRSFNHTLAAKPMGNRVTN
ncbi:hypothetical protein [Rubinisphaera italica]|uniref:AlgX/AlgJ SGNH hydrolase-like domain-containing protein n=1 Tax=Rubinisphaera italica TaxID=2527969 RepID=A0A5C5XE43_9PLAN|nr:hypothetical protein [Rubinisphaera italica]TWT61280.1 hypothetical protein Pan54_20160 [Rubinisphaera italica]